MVSEIYCKHCDTTKASNEFYRGVKKCKACYAAYAAERKQRIADSGKKFLKPERAKRERQKYISREEWQKFIATATDPFDKALWTLTATCGLRLQEALQLTPNDVDFDHMLIHIKTLKQKVEKEPDTIDLSPDVAEMLHSFKIKSNQRYFPISSVAAWKRFKRICKRAKLDPRYSPHALRHFCGLLTSEVTKGDVVKIAKVLRHTKIETAERYVHLLPELRTKLSQERWALMKTPKGEE